jgi:hypothetical protein
MPRRPNPWLVHVRRYRAVHKCSYKEALQCARATYRSSTLQCPISRHDIHESTPQATLERWLRDCFGPCFRATPEALARLPEMLHAVAESSRFPASGAPPCLSPAARKAIEVYRRRYARKVDSWLFQQKVQELLFGA